MGRGKLNMELITNEKSRMITYNKRKKGLIKKLQEFEVLCNVDACIIIFGPKFTGRPIDVEAWPVDRSKMSRIIRSYQSHGSDRKRNQDLSHFFEARKKKVDDDIAKIRKARMEARYPAWDNRLNLFQIHELSLLSAVLESKIESATAKVWKTRCERDNYVMVGSMNSSRLTPLTTTYNNGNVLIPKNELEGYNKTYSHHQMLPVLDVDPLNSSMLMTMMVGNNNGDDLSQSGCGSSSKRACNMAKEASYFEPLHQMFGNMTVLDNNSSSNNTRAHPVSYGGPNGQQTMLPYREDLVTVPDVSHQPRLPAVSEFYGIDGFEMRMH